MVYTNNLKIWFLSARKLSGIDDRKRPNVSNMGSVTIVNPRGFGALKNQIFRLFVYIQPVIVLRE